MMKAIVLVALLLCVVNAEVYFKETFEDGDKWSSRWIQSENKKDVGQAGDWKVTAGPFYGDEHADQGLATTENARFYTVSSKIAKPFSSVGKKLIVQFSVKNPQTIDCGGGYIKLLPSGLDQKKFNGDSKYNIMFGPDICGTSTRRVHVIFNHKDTNKLVKKDIRCETDKFTHVYTLIVDPATHSYEVRVDGVKRDGGKLEDDWEFTAPKMIKDPSQSKPSDWVENAQMDDPQDTKPANYDDIPRQIVDPDVQKPNDWDDEQDGEWEATKIDNPAYKGEWKAKKVANPAYKGAWEHPLIANPDYKEEKDLAQYADNAFVGFELWQVLAGSIFDNIIITDDEKEAQALLDSTFAKNKDAEKKMADDQDAAKKEQEDAARKAADAAKEAAKKDDKKPTDDDDDDDDEEDSKKKNKDEL